MELGQTPLYSGWTSESIVVESYTEIQMLAEENHSRMAWNVIINARFDNTWTNTHNKQVY